MLAAGRGLTFRARAKVNLGLEVLDRRPDGYHEILTVLWGIDLADRVTIDETRGGTELSCDAPDVPSSPDNLAWQAVELLRRTIGSPGEGDSRGVSIHIAKDIPVAAGLGGGSADAAAVLAGLNRLWGLGLPARRLGELATELGMDVPFFLSDGPALASGRGEVLTPLRGARRLWLVLVNPGFPLATRDVYRALHPGEFGTGARVRELVAALGAGASTVAARLWNGLEPAVAGLWPALASVKTALLDAGALGAVMSGSGPTVVGVARSREAAAAIRGALATRPWRVWIAPTISGPALSLAGRAHAASPWGVAKR